MPESPTELKYNFVFFYAESDFIRAIIGPSNEHMHVYSRNIDSNSKLISFLNRIHFSYSVNSRINLPFKSIWFRRMYRQKFSSDLPLCFVYLGGNSVRFDGGWCEYVRKRDPRNRQVILHLDLIAKKIHNDYNEIKKKVDLCITYDKIEAAKYGIAIWDRPVNTYVKIMDDDNSGEYENDVYYLAAAKDRLPQIMKIYEYLHSHGVKCRFQLVGVPKEQRGEYEGIEYTEPISYKEIIRNVIKSKCILEIKQGQSDDNFTLRHREASTYGRRILTTSHIDAEKYFHPGQWQIFDNPEEINVDFIKADMPPESYPCLVPSNPMSRLYAIQDCLEAQH